MFHAKSEIVRLFIAFVAGYTDLSKARLATLGGEGLEAALWKERGIAPKNGWLIECTRTRSKHLIARFPYRHCTRLAYFRRSAESIWGAKYGIDGFHLDLCGTYERSDSAFRPVIPIIMRGSGRCLAVTVSDQRRNSSHEHFENIRAEAEHLFGDALATRFLSKLEGDYQALPEQGIGLWADPAIGAVREFGFAYHLVRALELQSSLPIDRIERYLYVSNGKSRPFRMRTYFFHFGKVRSRWSVQDAVQLWCGSPLQCVTENGITPVSPQTRKEAAQMISYPNLEKLVRTLGGAHLDEFNKLIADADYGRQVRAIAYGSGGSSPAAPESPKSAKTAKNVPNGDTLSVQLDLVRAAAKGSKEMIAAKQKGIKTLRIKGKGKNRTIGALHARTSGKFRTNFFTRLAARGMLDDAVVAELAGIYKMSAEQLRKEAGVS